MDDAIIVIAIVASVCVIILFFKIWGMTNDVKVIRQMAQYGIAKGEQFKDKDGNIWRVGAFLSDGKIRCYCQKYGEQKLDRSDIAERLG